MRCPMPIIRGASRQRMMNSNVIVCCKLGSLPARSNLVLFWDSGEPISMGLPHSLQPVTIKIFRVMMAIRLLEAHLRENIRQEVPTRSSWESYLSKRLKYFRGNG